MDLKQAPVSPTRRQPEQPAQGSLPEVPETVVVTDPVLLMLRSMQKDTAEAKAAKQGAQARTTPSAISFLRAAYRNGPAFREWLDGGDD